MFRMKVKLSSGLGNKKAALRDRLTRWTNQSIQRIILNIHKSVMRNTPVWSGRALANYHWSNDNSVVQREPVRIPEKPGEERRTVNSQFAENSRKSLVYNRKIYLTNDAVYPDGHTFEDLEYGRLPTQSTSRVPPQGIMRLALARYPKRIVLNQETRK